MIQRTRCAKKYTHIHTPQAQHKICETQIEFYERKRKKKNQIDASLVFSTTKFALERLKMKAKQNV